jgi:hypothetical protein
MRPEQEDAVKKPADYFQRQKKSTKKIPAFSVECEDAYSARPLQPISLQRWVENASSSYNIQTGSSNGLGRGPGDRTNDLKGLQFVSRTSGNKVITGEQEETLVCFLFHVQDYLRQKSAGGIKARTNGPHAMNWDCIVLDEYHFRSNGVIPRRDCLTGKKQSQANW